MQRLIDADALIEAMTKFSNATGEDMTHGIFYAHIAPTIDAVPKWIPCSERLPEIKGHYVSETCLVCLDNGAIGFSELQENIFGQVGWPCEREDDYHEPLGDVIAWMPLPKPYEVENG